MDSDYFRQRISMLRSLSGRASSHILTSCLFEAKSLRKRPPSCVEGSSAEESGFLTYLPLVIFWFFIKTNLVFSGF